MPVVFDVLLLRPFGLRDDGRGRRALRLPGAADHARSTRPTQIWKPLGPLVAAPAKYTFSDPLGYHPEN